MHNDGNHIRVPPRSTPATSHFQVQSSSAETKVSNSGFSIVLRLMVALCVWAVIMGTISIVYAGVQKIRSGPVSEKSEVEMLRGEVKELRNRVWAAEERIGKLEQVTQEGVKLEKEMRVKGK